MRMRPKGLLQSGFLEGFAQSLGGRCGVYTGEDTGEGGGATEEHTRESDEGQRCQKRGEQTRGEPVGEESCGRATVG
jgi:hypothetical protein